MQPSVSRNDGVREGPEIRRLASDCPIVRVDGLAYRPQGVDAFATNGSNRDNLRAIE